MKITIISENTKLIQFLSSNTSIKVENVYSNLETEYDKFINELNRVDVALLVDHSDLSTSLSKLTLAITSKKAFMFVAKEIVIVTYNDPVDSPTSNISDKLDAFSLIMSENGQKVRIVKVDTINFPVIYEAIIAETTLEESDLKTYVKYKYNPEGSGHAIKPKKQKGKLFRVRDKPNERPALRSQDLHTSEMVKNKTLNIGSDPNKLTRTNNVIIPLENSTQTITPLILVSGVKYSGKTTFSIKAVKELQKNGFCSLLVDATGRTDYNRLLRYNSVDIPILSGSDIFTPTDKPIVAIQLAHPAPTASFLSSLTHLSSGKICIFCEVDLEYVPNYLATYNGSCKVIVVTEYDFTKLRDLALQTKTLEDKVSIIVNTREEVRLSDAEVSTIRDIFKFTNTVGSFQDMVHTIMLLGVC